MGGIMKRLLLAVVWAALLVLAAADFGHAADVTTTWVDLGGCSAPACSRLWA